MLLNNYFKQFKIDYFKKIPYSVLKKIYPFKQIKIFQINTSVLNIKEPVLFFFEIYSTLKEEISDNYCFSLPDISAFSLDDNLTDDLVPVNLIDYLVQVPLIEYFEISLTKPLRSGKVYTEDKKEKNTSITMLFKNNEVNERCVHGLVKSWCSTCKEQKIREIREKGHIQSKFNVFDLIFPILQPPLGDNFDNTLVLPDGKSLYNFQIFGVKFLVNNTRALLGDEMGLGKSIQAIMALRVLYRQAALKFGLIVCPKSVLIDWEKKLKEWSPELRVLRIHGPKEQRRITWKSPAHIYLTTYETLRSDLPDFLATVSYNLDPKRINEVSNYEFIILDEIQKIKNPNTEIYRSIKKINANIRWGLSGTPLENKAEELISIFSYLIPGLLRYEEASRHYYIRDKIKPYFLRRRIKEALPELPEKIQDEIWLELTENQRNTYDTAEREGVIRLHRMGNEITIQNVIALISKLKQICNIDPDSGESCKFDYLYENLNEIVEDGNKALVFSQFPNVTLKIIEPHLRKFNPLFFDGSLSDIKRDEYIERFQREDKNKIMLMSVKAGGQGVTLTNANYVYHFDHWWNPATADQAEGRAHRIGQSKTVFVTHLYTSETIEERIYDLLEEKKHIFKNIIDDLSDTESIKKILTIEELFSLFNLKKPPRYKD
ncbi:MAG: DEAD/DEAH box helicase [Actinobacteria bacterium]|nr:DEAD/DEAH box helicase [Actinomycetota bacterium]